MNETPIERADRIIREYNLPRNYKPMNTEPVPAWMLESWGPGWKQLNKMNTETKHTPLVLSVDAITGEPLFYNNGHELKVVPVDRSQSTYINIGGANKENLAILIASAPDMAKELESLRLAVGRLSAAVGVRDKDLAQLRADKVELVAALKLSKGLLAQENCAHVKESEYNSIANLIAKHTKV